MRKIFSVPLNPKLTEEQFNEFYEFLKTYKDYIRDVYFTSRIAPFKQDAMGDVFFIQEDESHAIHAALHIQRTLDIPISATFNNINVPPTQQNLDLFIKNFKPLYDAGVRNATIPHTHWMATGQIKKAFPELYVKNTILRNVTTAQEVVNLATYGFDYINLDRDLMRNRDALLQIKKAKQYVKDTLGKDIAISLLANEGCAGGCSMMDEHYHFNNTRDNARPQYFNDPISRVSCPSWDVQDPAIFLKRANFTPWRADWDEFIDELGIDSIKMHGREAPTRLYETMDMIKRYAAGEELLYPTFEQYLEDTNLAEKPITVWREKIKNCKFECWDCHYCDKVYKAKSDIEASELVKHVAACIEQSGVPTIKLDIPGLTSIRVQSLLNRLAQGVDTYLEVGTALGATFCAVIKDNPIMAIAIDNWIDNVQPRNEGRVAMPQNDIQVFAENVRKYQGNSKITVLNGNCFAVDVTPFAGQIKMFFYDGPHEVEACKLAMTHFAPALSEEAIVIFDDANWNNVVEGAKQGIEAAGLKVSYEKLLLNDEEDPNGWWNGLYIAVVRKAND